MKLYSVDNAYINFLRNVDKQVLSNEDDDYSHTRKYLWIELNLNNNKYYIPFSGPKDTDYNSDGSVRKSNITIKRLLNKDGVLKGRLRINNMIPVPDEALIEYKVSNELDLKYKALVEDELDIIKNRLNEINRDAKYVYLTKCKNEHKYNWENACCDFKLLEQKCLEYQNIVKSKPIDLLNKIKKSNSNTEYNQKNFNVKNNNNENER